MATFNGHKNWNHWNVSLWINNDECLYHMARNLCRGMSRNDAADELLARLKAEGNHKTPDGAPYSFTTVRAAMKGM